MCISGFRHDTRRDKIIIYPVYRQELLTSAKKIMNNIHYFIRHINPLMFDVIDNKPEGVARGLLCINTRPTGSCLCTITSIMGGFMCYKSEDNFA